MTLWPVSANADGLIWMRRICVVSQGSRSTSFTFQVEYQGADEIADGRVVLFFAPKADEEPRLGAFELEAPLPLFAKDVVRAAAISAASGQTDELMQLCVRGCSAMCGQATWSSLTAPTSPRRPRSRSSRRRWTTLGRSCLSRCSSITVRARQLQVLQTVVQ